MSRPFVVNNQPIGEGRMCWLFVPRLRADGWLRIDGQEHRFESELAYHDHNWGRFSWGDDFGWTWGTILPARAGGPVVAGVPANDRPATVALPVPGDLRVAPRRARRDIPARRGADALLGCARPRRGLHPATPDAAAAGRRDTRRTGAGRDRRDAGGRRGARRIPPEVLRSRCAAERGLVCAARPCSARRAAPPE